MSTFQRFATVLALGIGPVIAIAAIAGTALFLIVVVGSSAGAAGGCGGG